MKKLLIILLIIGIIYLNGSYAQFYNFLSQKRLLPPSHSINTTIGNSNNETIKFTTLGDSLTAGVGVSDYKLSYPYLTALKISSKKVALINLARTGATSKDVLIDQVPQAISAKPDVITLLIGVNDVHNLVSLKKFEDNLTQSVKALKQTKARIYLLSIPYLGSDKIVFFPYNLILDLRTKQFNEIIKKTTKDFGVNFIDLYSLKKPADFYSEDQFHPSKSGYKVWSEVINVN